MPRQPHPWCCPECSLGQKVIAGVQGCYCACHAIAKRLTGKPIWLGSPLQAKEKV